MPPQPLNNDKQATRSRVGLENHAPGLGSRSKGSSAGARPMDDRRSSRPHQMERDTGDVESAHDSSHRRQRRQAPVHAQSNGTSATAMNSQYGGMMPMGGMGMGMGMPFGYGMGYGGMMGGGGFMAGPMSMVYSINYFIAMMGQLTAMFGMSVQAIGPLYQMARDSLVQLERSIRQSEVRRWLQRKSAQSPLLRAMLVLASMVAASQAVRLLRFLIELRMRRSTPAITAGSTVAAASGPLGEGLASAAGSL